MESGLSWELLSSTLTIPITCSRYSTREVLIIRKIIYTSVSRILVTWYRRIDNLSYNQKFSCWISGSYDFEYPTQKFPAQATFYLQQNDRIIHFLIFLKMIFVIGHFVLGVLYPIRTGRSEVYTVRSLSVSISVTYSLTETLLAIEKWKLCLDLK